MTSIDLNSDLGESFGRWVLGDDAAMVPLISSANVACGFHAGDPTTLRRTCEQAAAAGVVVGAQVSYRDLAGFGRRFIDMDPIELTDDIVYQIGGLQAIALVAGTSVRYVKPHGALYNAAVHHRGAGQGHRRRRAQRGPDLSGAGAARIRAADRRRGKGLRTVAEAFADRGYTPDGTLVPRNQPGAVLHDPARGRGQGARMVTDSRVLCGGRVGGRGPCRECVRAR